MHAYIMYIHISVHTHTCAHTPAHTYLYVLTHTRIAVHVYMNFQVGMVRVYRILRAMPQPAINIPNISFAANYGKVRNHTFSITTFCINCWGYLWVFDMPQLGPCTIIIFPEGNGDPTTYQSDCLTVTPTPLHIVQVIY